MPICSTSCWSSTWRPWQRPSWSISMRWRRTACASARAQAPPRSGAARRSTGIRRWRKRWSRSSSAKSQPTRTPAMPASARRRRARRASRPSGWRRRSMSSRRSSSSASSANKNTATASSRRSRAPLPPMPRRRVMKMADGGFRPAYKVQVASAAGEQIVVAIDVTNTGSDRGLLRPMLERWRQRSGRLPQRHLADGGFSSAEDLEWAHAEGVDVYCPPTRSKSGVDPYQPRRGDGEGVLAWRARMASEAGKEQYKERSKCECIHARWRNWDLRQLPQKVRAVLLLYALTNNILQGHRLATA